ncbi:MAG: DUF2807 domain-containing protein [Pseudomonadota bacterium]
MIVFLGLRYKRLNQVIITIAGAMVYVPTVLYAAEQQFADIKSIALGPQAVALTIKNSSEKSAESVVKVDVKSTPGRLASWHVLPNGVLTLDVVDEESKVKVNSASPLAVTVNIPEDWSGRWAFLGGGHRILGQALKLKYLDISVVGAANPFELSGEVDIMRVTIVGSVKWQSPDLNVRLLEWNAIGEGEAKVKVRERLWGSLLGNWQLGYSGKPSVVSISSSGGAKLLRE